MKTRRNFLVEAGAGFSALALADVLSRVQSCVKLRKKKVGTFSILNN